MSDEKEQYTQAVIVPGEFLADLFRFARFCYRNRHLLDDSWNLQIIRYHSKEPGSRVIEGNATYDTAAGLTLGQVYAKFETFRAEGYDYGLMFYRPVDEALQANIEKELQRPTMH